MTDLKQHLTPTIIEYCHCCSKEEGRAIVAYCCYMAFADRSLRRMELLTVRAIAQQMGITETETATMARKVRRRRMKIKMPKSGEARKLIFHLAMRLAVADDQIDARERLAIDKLASQLQIPADKVESELEKLGAIEEFKLAPPVPKSSELTKPLPLQSDLQEMAFPLPDTDKPKGFFESLFDSLTSQWVVEDLEADLFLHPKQFAARKKGELEYTLTKDGSVELEIELDRIDLQPNETISILVAGRHVCDIVIPFGRVDQTMREIDHGIIPKITRGDSAEIQHLGRTLLSGQFKPN